MIKQRFLKSLVLSLLSLLIYSNAYCVTEFISVINKAGSEDYNTFTLWEAAMDDAGNIIDGTVLTGNWDNKTGSIPADGIAVDWDGGASTGTLIHASENNGGSGGDQYLIDVTGGSLADNDVILDVATSTDGFTIAGTPDSAIITAELFDDDGDLTDAFTMNGLTANSTNHWKVTSPVGERHDGTVSSGAKIKTTFTGDSVKIVFVSDDSTLVEWLIIEWNNSGADPDNNIAYFVDRNSATIRNCIIYVNSKGSPGVSAHTNFGIYIATGGTSVQKTNNILDNIVYGFNHTTNNWRGILHLTGTTRTHIFNTNNNTVFNNNLGIEAGDGVNQTHNIKNNISIGNDTDFIFGDGINNNDYNCSEDGTATGANSLTTGSDSDFISVTSGSEDFHIKETSVQLEAGTDLGTTNNVNMDINNNDRDELNGTVWSIGAHQLYLRAKINIAASEDFNTLTLWEASRDNDPDLVSRHAIEIADCYDDDGLLSEDRVTINGFITDATNFVKITVPEGERHSGVLTDGSSGTGFRYKATAEYAHAFSLSDPYTIMEWIQVEKNSTQSTYNIFQVLEDNCIVRNSIGIRTGGGNGIGVFNNQITGIIMNNILMNLYIGIQSNSFSNPALEIYNNTLVDISYVGISFGDNTHGSILKNNLVIEAATICYDANSDNGTFTNNGASDTSGTAGLDNLTTSEFEDYAGDDFHLASGATSIDAGTDLGTSPLGVQFDIDNRDRDAEGDTWDIGADEFVSEVVARRIILTRWINSLNK